MQTFTINFVKPIKVLIL